MAGALLYQTPVDLGTLDGINVENISINRIGTVPSISASLTEGYYLKDDAGNLVLNELGLPKWQRHEMGRVFNFSVPANDVTLNTLLTIEFQNINPQNPVMFELDDLFQRVVLKYFKDNIYSDTMPLL